MRLNTAVEAVMTGESERAPLVMACAEEGGRDQTGTVRFADRLDGISHQKSQCDGIHTYESCPIWSAFTEYRCQVCLHSQNVS